MNQRGCEHDKVLANYSYMTNPPQTPWICSKCGDNGVHTPPQPQHTYNDLLNKFDLVLKSPNGGMHAPLRHI